MELTNMSQVVTAYGALGVASFGLVDLSRVVGGGVNHFGFKGIRTRVVSLTPGGSDNALSQTTILTTLQAKWFSGAELDSQKLIAKSLIMQHLNPSNSTALSIVIGLNAAALTSIASGIASGTALTDAQSAVYKRLDSIISALLDGTYDRADQAYRNGTRAVAAAITVMLAVVGGFLIYPPVTVATSALFGVLAAPLAPIAKDLSTKAVPLLVRFLVKKIGG